VTNYVFVIDVGIFAKTIAVKHAYLYISLLYIRVYINIYIGFRDVVLCSVIYFVTL